MIPKIDSYFKQTLEKYLNKVLGSVGTENERYIIDEALGGMEKGTIDVFKNSFTSKSKNVKPVDVSYVYPSQKEDVGGRYVIMRGKTQPSDKYIGNVTGVHEDGRPANEENIKSELLKVQHDDNGYFLQTSLPILNLITISELTIDNFVDFERDFGDDFRLNLNENAANILGYNLDVTYLVKDKGYREDYGGDSQGFMVNESIEVNSVSNNIDTVRCLDSILRYIMIVMRSSFEENNYFQLQTFGSAGLSVADQQMDKPLYVIPLVISYKVTYSLPNDGISRFKKLVLNGEDITNG